MPKQGNLGTPIWPSPSNQQFTCTFGHKQIPICAAKLYRKQLKSKQRYSLWNEIGDSMLNVMPIAPPTIEELLASPLSKFITFAANDCGYSGSFTKIIVTAAHPFFLKAKSEASKRIIPIGTKP